MNHRTAICIIGCLILGCILPAHATTMRPLSIAELNQLADAIVVGTVTSRESRWHHHRIMTHASVRVDDRWAGAGTHHRALEVITLGGVVGNIGQDVPASPKLQIGEQAVFFLKEDPVAPGQWYIIGLSQGFFPVSATPEDGLGPGTTTTEPQVLLPNAAQTMELGAFRQLVVGVSR